MPRHPGTDRRSANARLAHLASGALIVGALSLSAAPALAGCNSGSSPPANLLTSANCQANAAFEEDTAVGQGAFAGGAATALGRVAKARGEFSSAIGVQAEANGREAIAVGLLARAFGNYAIAIGGRAGNLTAATGATMIGRLAGNLGAGIWSTAIGAGLGGEGAPNALGNFSIAIGGGDNTTHKGALARHVYGVAIGTGAVASGLRTTAVGTFAGSGSTAAANNRNAFFGEGSGQLVTGGGNTASGVLSGYTVQGELNSAFGNSSGQFVTGSNNVAVGVLAGHSATGDANVAIGRDAGKSIGASNTVAVGTNALASRDRTVAIGNGARALRSRAVAIGDGSVADVVDAVSVGCAGSPRRIMNVADAADATDAVNLNQVNALIGAALSAALTPGAGLKPAREKAGRPSAARRVTSAGPTANIARTGASDRPGIVAGGAGAPIPAAGVIAGWAGIKEGKVAESRNLTASAKSGIGSYELAFGDRSLRKCTFNGTLRNTIGFLLIDHGARPNSVTIETRGPTGTLADVPFHLVVIC